MDKRWSKRGQKWSTSKRKKLKQITDKKTLV